MTTPPPIADPLFDLTNRVVVLTGASSGIGASAARCMAERGARLVLAARREAVVTALADELPGAIGIGCDVSVPEDCERLVATAVAKHGRVDVLINNAATYQISPAEDESVESFRHVLNTNLVSVFALSQAAGRHMLQQGEGSIINIASVFGLVGSGTVRQASYAASKGGVVNLTRELSAQWVRRGVRVNAVAPAYFATEMTTTMWEDEASVRWVRRQTPVGRRGELEELHGALVYLASRASSYVTGTVLPVDGGWTSV